MLSNEEISRLLEKNQNLTFPSSLPPNNHNMINNSSIVYRVDTNMYAANDPIEDRQAQVYDGEESFFAGMNLVTIGGPLFVHFWRNLLC